MKRLSLGKARPQTPNLQQKQQSNIPPATNPPQAAPPPPTPVTSPISLEAQIAQRAAEMYEQTVRKSITEHRRPRKDMPPKLKSMQSELNLLRKQLAPITMASLVGPSTDASAISRLARARTGFFLPHFALPTRWFDPGLLQACGEDFDLGSVLRATEQLENSYLETFEAACLNLLSTARESGLHVCDVERAPTKTPMLVLKPTTLMLSLASSVAVVAWAQAQEDLERAEGDVLCWLAGALNQQPARKDIFGLLMVHRQVLVYHVQGPRSSEWGVFEPQGPGVLSRVLLTDPESLGFDLPLPRLSPAWTEKIKLPDLFPCYVGPTSTLFGCTGRDQYMVKVFVEKKELEKESKALSLLAGVEQVPRLVSRDGSAGDNCLVLARHPLRRLRPGVSFLILADVLEALDKAHEMGLCHRGVRFESILLDEDGKRAMLAEWGDSGGAGSVFAGFCTHGVQFASSRVLKGLIEQREREPDPLKRRVAFDERDDLVALVKVGYYLAECGGSGMWVGEFGGSDKEKVVPGDWEGVLKWWQGRLVSAMFAALGEAAVQGNVDEMKRLLKGGRAFNV